MHFLIYLSLLILPTMKIKFTRRQPDIIRYGTLPAKLVARELGISEKTVRNHWYDIGQRVHKATGLPHDKVTALKIAQSQGDINLWQLPIEPRGE
jgi:DNA-binding NarL/FixJ family response regulator